MRLSCPRASLLGLVTLAALGLAAAPAQAQLTLTPAGIADGFILSTFATGFPTSSNTGPFGVAFPSGGGVLVTDGLGNIHLFPTDTDGQDAAAAPVGYNYGVSNALDLVQVGSAIYMTQQGDGDVVQVNPNGTLNQIIVTGITQATGMIADPINGHLFVSNANNTIWEVDPIAKTKTVFVSGSNIDGLTISADGSIVYGAGKSTGDLLGFSTATKALVFNSGSIPGGIDGSALGTGSLVGNAFVNTNSGTVYEVNLATKVTTLIASGGSRGDFVTVDPNNSLLLTQTDRIIRLTPGNGGGFVGGNVPESSDLALLALGLLPVGLIAYKRRRSNASA